MHLEERSGHGLFVFYALTNLNWGNIQWSENLDKSDLTKLSGHRAVYLNLSGSFNFIQQNPIHFSMAERSQNSD